MLEVNHSPSFATDAPIDIKTKSQLIRDTITLLGLTSQRKHQYKTQAVRDLETRMRTGKSNKPVGAEKEERRTEFNDIRDRYELENSGEYELIYPIFDTTHPKAILYKQLLETSTDLFLKQTGGSRMKRLKTSVECNKPKPFLVGASGHR